MIKEGHLKLKDVIFIYSKPPEQALIGVIKKIDYPIITVEVVKRDGKNKFNDIEKIDISENIALTVMGSYKIKTCLSDKEIKRLNKIKENEVVDMFEGTY